MVNPRGPEAIINQVETLSGIYQDNFSQIDHAVCATFSRQTLEQFNRVYAIGDGDSYFAAVAMEMAFRELAGINYHPDPALKFIEYNADYLHADGPQPSLLVAISASGTSTRAIQAIEKVREKWGEIALAGLIGRQDSPLSKIVDHNISVELPDLGRSPGIRTYVASLMGLFSLAVCLGEAKGRYSSRAADRMRQAISELAEVVSATIACNRELAQEAAQLYKHAPFMSAVGSGPSFGTAMFSAAKTIEASGLYVSPQELEEWGHIERFAYPLDFPVFLIAPPGKAYWRAAALARAVKLLGHPLMAVVAHDDQEVVKLADIVFPVQGAVPEYLSPLLYYLAGTLLAYHIATQLGRSILMSDNEYVARVRAELARQTKVQDDP